MTSSRSPRELGPVDSRDYPYQIYAIYEFIDVIDMNICY